ncbi:oxidoreductase [Solirubrobacter sp. CPCC 204708]|uniref:PDR/VanB family oxidoreductase n=1 Tax=Solirubrobacter deserti TaxID=2282478 RepID=A0ABT4RG68_9ACTN|nr:PDR/VanB family oxidoreductase [Solirubrobacter deserti]MBE2318192.1 oxidoreductase [Solirubrobacter deserti]MDA0137473.1 PDR/VanB family oxidoreductase [Solirubrobacter deserti]
MDVVQAPPVLSLTVAEVKEEADGVVSLRFVASSGERLPRWAPGAHVDLRLANGIERQYSLCGDPADHDGWRVGVLREPESRGGSAFIHEQLSAGDSVVVQGPRNNFPLVAADAYVFVAGGIGITPLLPMIAAADARGAEWQLVYGGRTAASMAFTAELAAYGPRVKLWPQDVHGLIDLDGLLGAPRDGVAVYCCGPEVLIAAVEERCAAWPAGALHVERFRPRPGALDGARTAFEVECEYTGITVLVRADQSIAQAVESAGIEVATSCREGTCGTCETVVLEGVPDHRDSFLSSEEREANDVMMICCSRARSERLVLDL